MSSIPRAEVSILRDDSMILDGVRSNNSFAVSPPTNTLSPRARVVNFEAFDEEPSSKTPPHTLSPATKMRREAVQQVKAERRAHFAEFETPCLRTSHVKCTHFGVAAMALSYVGGVKVTLEDVFHSSRLPLSFVLHQSLTLSEMYDVVNEFIAKDPRFGSDAYNVELVHYDTSVSSGEVGHGYLANETAHRCVVETLNDFRTSLIEETARHGVIRIINYDPFVVEQGLVLLEEDDGESSDGLVNMVISPSVQRMKATSVRTSFTKENAGNFAAVTDFNNATHLVNLAAAALDTDVHAVCSEVPISSLYKAMCKENTYLNRPRGYVKITKREKAIPTNGRSVAIPAVPLELRSLSKGIAPHMIALAYAMHTLTGMVHTTTQWVSDIVRSVELPFDFIGSSRISVEHVTGALVEYLQAKSLLGTYNVGVDMIKTRLQREDSQTTMSIMELGDLLRARLPCKECAVIACIDTNIANNVVGLERDPHWVVLRSYDSEYQQVYVHDTIPRKYTAVWCVGLERLHRALTNHGMITIWKGTPPESHKAQLDLDPAYRTPPKAPHNFFGGVFEFPPLELPVTLCAFALHKLGHPTSVEDIVRKTTCVDVSFLLRTAYSVMDIARILRRYIGATSLPVKVDTVMVECDNVGQKKMGLMSFFVEMKRHSLDPNCEVIFYFSRNIITHGNMHHAILVRFNEDEESVTLCDANPHRTARLFDVPITMLYNALQDVSLVARRSFGYVVLSKTSAPVVQQTSRFEVLRVPSRNPFTVQISPHIAGMAFALSELGTPTSAEDIFYGSRSALQMSLASLRDGVSLDAMISIFAKYGVTATSTNVDAIPRLVAEPSVVVLVVYATSTLHLSSVKGTGAALVDTVSGEDCVVADAEPTSWGETTKVSLAHLRDAVSSCATGGVLCLKKT
eukprot:PhM_4_TR3690/c0_g1_i1/m.47532